MELVGVIVGWLVGVALFLGVEEVRMRRHYGMRPFRREDRG